MHPEAPERRSDSSRKSASTAPFLLITGPDRPGQTSYTLTAQRHVIGRRPDAQIVLDHVGVSRSHAALELAPSGRWWILDLESTNGTFVNGARVAERLLNPGDVVQIAEWSLTLRLPSLPEFPSPLSTAYGLPGWREPRSDRTRITQSMPATHVGQLISADHLASVMSLGRTLMRLERAESRLAALCEFAVGSLSPALGAAAIRIFDSKEVTTLCGPFNRASRTQGMRIDPEVVEQVLEQRDSVVVFPSGTEPGSTSLIGPDATVVSVPLASLERSMDALYAEFPKRSATAEWTTLLTLAAETYQQAELVWQMRQQVRQNALLEAELQMACQIQERLVPTNFSASGLDLAIGFQPCRWVGGDYADVIPLPDGRLLLGIADVCGKGLQAALVASSIHTLVRASCELARDLPSLMGRLNDYLLDYLPDHSFVTMQCVAVNCASGAIEFVSAGHPAAIVIRESGALDVLHQADNVGLGIIKTDFISQKSQLDGGDVLLMYTDGLTEMVNNQGEPFGAERLASEFCRIVSLSPGASVDSMRRRLNDLCETYRGARAAADDRTFLVATRRTSTKTLMPPPLNERAAWNPARR
jgi:serine phosphatase RsbU (regulator of sigma subunit)